MINDLQIKNILNFKKYEEIKWEYNKDYIQLIKTDNKKDISKYYLKMNKIDIMIILKKDQFKGYCNCKLGYAGKPCEHLIWAAFKINETLKNTIIQEEKKEELDVFKNLINQKKNIDIIIFKLVIKDKIELYAGYEKEYKITNINEFISKISLKKELNYGKEFCTGKYEIHQNSLKLYNFLKYINTFDYNELMLEDLLKTVINQNVIYNNENYFVQNSIKDIYINIEGTDEFDIKFSNILEYEKISENIYVNSVQKIIYISEDKFKNQFISQILSFENNLLKLNKIKTSEFKDTILPKIYNEFSINLDSRLDYEIVEEQLDINLFCYMVDKEIRIKPQFLYGKYNADDTYEKKLIRRDLEKENELINILKRQGYVYDTKISEFHISANRDQFLFLTKYLFELKQKYKIDIDEELKAAIINFDSSHIKVNILNQEDFFEIKIEDSDLFDNELNNIIKAYEKKEIFYKLKNNKFLKLTDNKVYKQLLFIHDLKKNNKYKMNTYRLPKYKSLLIMNEVKNKFNKFDFNQSFLNYVESLSLIKDLDSKKYKLDNVTLREYQKKGINWMSTLYEGSFSALLADEMGLGKTIQVIGFLKAKNLKKSLIVVPKTLIYNWEKEFQKYLPKWDISLITGNKKERLEVLKKAYNKNIIITSYSSLVNDYNEYSQFEFESLVIDEAQYIKNPKSKTSQVIKNIKASFFIALSGTPIENDLVELWSIFDFLLPGYLGDLQSFKKKYKDNEDIEVLKKSLSPFIMRRLKKNVLKEIPDKIESVVYVPMDLQQKKLYKHLNDEIKNIDKKNNNMQILSQITKLRQIAIDPGLVVDEYVNTSQKIETCIELVREIMNSKEKVLIFSQYTRFLKKIKKALKDEEIKSFYLDGKTKPIDRLKDTEKFNKNNIPVYLISLKVGGIGLNLTSASNVIISDPWWNPAVESQAIDRTHRIGQNKIVNVYSLITKGSIEEKINLLKNQKQLISSNVLDNKIEEINKMNFDDIIELLN